ncbi:MAG: PA2778 family cysteine peptidase [Pseudohongiella sp.]|nr:PA2778 family cysteine peptidase [Pseudohongiella sp.]
MWRHCVQRKTLRLCLIAALVLVGLQACLSAPQTLQLQARAPQSLASPVLLSDVGFFPQEDFQCGPAALATVLTFNQVEVTPEELVSQVYIPARRGSLQIEMLATARRYGRLPYVLTGTLEKMLMEVAAGQPVLVMQNLGLSRWPQWHYAVAVGFDLAENTITLRSGTRKEYVMPMAVFERTWARAGHWSVVVLQPGQMPVDADETTYFQTLADFELSHAGASALAAWHAGVLRWPASSLMAIGLSNQLYAQGLQQDAANVLIDFLKLETGSAVAHNNLAWLMFELGEPERAMTYAQRAASLDPAFAQTPIELHSKISSGK